MEQEAKNPRTPVGCPSVYRSRSRAIRNRSAFCRAFIIACRRRGSYCLPTKRRIVHLAPHADAAPPSPHPPQRRIHGGGRAPLSRISEERLAPHQEYLISSCTERVLFFSPVLVSSFLPMFLDFLSSIWVCSAACLFRDSAPISWFRAETFVPRANLVFLGWQLVSSMANGDGQEEETDWRKGHFYPCYAQGT